MIRDPEFVNKCRTDANAEDAAEEQATLDHCTHCNDCVVSTLDPTRGMRCLLRDQQDIEDIGRKQK